MIHDPWIAGLTALAIFASWMACVMLLKHIKVIPSGMSRKIIHIGTGPIFLLSWIIFPESGLSKYIAAIIPGGVVLLILLTGKRIIGNPLLVTLMSRLGDRRELMTGPLFYGLVFVSFTIFFWKSVYSILPLMILCTGDGFADIVGNKVKSVLLPWSRHKTLAGSIAMMIFGAVGSLLILLIFINTSAVPGSMAQSLLPVLVVAFISSLVESFSPSKIDNITVPVTALICTLLLFPIG